MRFFSRGGSVLAVGFDRDPGAAGVFTLPSWMAITCATTGRTAQTGTSALRTGLGANAARAMSFDGSLWGLGVECARTNLLGQSDSMTDGGYWTPSTMGATASQVDPAGGTAATLFTSAGGQQSYYQDGDTGRCGSVWAKGVSGASPYGHLRHSSSGLWADIVAATWARVSFTDSANVANQFFAIESRDVPSGAGLLGAGSFLVYGAQLEADAKYPGSYIPTGAGAKARSADVLAIGSPANIAPGGFYDAELIWTPHFAATETLADAPIIHFATNDRLFFRQSDRKIVHTAAADAGLVSPALTFPRNTPIHLRITQKAGKRQLIVASTVTAGVAGTSWTPIVGTPQAAMTLPAAAYVLGNATGAVEGASLNRIAWYLDR